MRPSNILFVVAHPDDEVIWCGATIAELSRFPNMHCYVVCLAGANGESPRKKEFMSAMAAGGYAGGVVLGDRLPKALSPLPEIGESIEAGLKQLNLNAGDLDLVITHAPYGDEQKNPHHMQAYLQARSWSAKSAIPFGFFSCVPVPYVSQQSLMQRPMRKDSFYVTNWSRCRASIPLWRRLLDPLFRDRFQAPLYYLQFASSSAVKQKMLDCYPSIDVDMHRRNYVSATSPVEGFYLFSEGGMNVFLPLLREMEIDANPIFFESVGFRSRFREVFLKR